MVLELHLVQLTRLHTFFHATRLYFTSVDKKFALELNLMKSQLLVLLGVAAAAINAKALWPAVTAVHTLTTLVARGGPEEYGYPPWQLLL